MKVGRVIAFLAFLASSLVGYACFKELMLVNHPVWRWILLCSSLSSAMTSLVVLALLFFAVTPGESGEFVIDRKSWYGKRFMESLENQLGEAIPKIYRDNKFSFCEIFWYTNFLVVLDAIGFLLLVFVAIFIAALIYLFFTNIRDALSGIAVIAGIVIGCILVVWAGGELFSRIQRTFKRKSPEFYRFAANATWNVRDITEGFVLPAFIVLLVLVLIGIFLYHAWKYSSFWLPVAGVLAVIAGFVTAAYLGVWLLKKTNFGYIYDRYLCPRVRIQ